MKLLLDTHIWIWLLAGSDDLPKSLRHALDGDDAELWISPITVWETILLGERKRIDLLPTPSEWVRSVLEKQRFRQASLTHEVALKSREIKLSHEDPADRFLVATAMVYELKLVTVDKHLLKLKEVVFR